VILRRLVEYAERLEAEGHLTPPTYGRFRINWTISLSPAGKLEGFIPAPDKKGTEIIVPRYGVKRTSGIKADLLADEGEYVLGIPRDPGRTAQAMKRHTAFIELTRRCAEQTADPQVKAVLEFLDAWSEGEYRDRVPDELEPRDKMTFRVDGIILAQDSDKVRDFWMDEQAPDADGPRMMCLVTGSIGSVAQRLPHNSGVPDKKGTPSKAALVSAQNAAFMSYGLENSLTSPISHMSGERFAKALDSLVSSAKSRLYMGSFVYLFWTREDSKFDIVSLLDKPTPEMVQNMLLSVYRNRPASSIETDDFYALSLSRSKARVAVRDYIETKLTIVARNLDKWFADQRIVNQTGEFDRYFGVKALARAAEYRGQETSADADLRVRPASVASLLHAAIEGGAVDRTFLAAIVQRIRKGVSRQDGTRNHVTHSLAACAKLALLRERGETVAETLEELNPRVEDPAYHCGRLLAQLEELQKAAIPGVKATIVDRYYGAASSTPASVFGTLMRNHNAHVGKIRKERPGVGVAIQDRIGEITQKIGASFPTTLTMRQQAVFALGFYHQRAHNRAEARAAREARDNKGEGNQQ
jgi:CRISPR-associated protein Csd1